MLRKVIRDKKRYYIPIKGSILWEAIATFNEYAPDKRAPKYVRQKLGELQKEIDESTIIVGVLNIPLSEMDRLLFLIISVGENVKKLFMC